MKYSQQAWNQLKNITVERLIKALEKDDWVRDEGAGNIYVYYHPETGKRITIHYHPKKTYSQNLLKSLLGDIGWSEEEMKKLKLIK